MKRLLLTVLPVAPVMAVLVLFLARGPYVGVLEPHQPHPRSHDDLVVRVEETAGMGTVQGFFSRPPVLVVAGDGTAYAYRWGTSTGLVQPVVTFHLDEGDIQSLLKRAARDGLLADHASYSMPEVQDGGQTDVVLATDNGQWRHSAYALDGGWSVSARGHLADFVNAATALAAKRPAEPYRPTALRVLVMHVPHVARGAAEGESAAHWPTGTGVDLARIDDCGVVTSPAAIRVLSQFADRFYLEAGRTYLVAAAVSLPGDDCGAGDGS
jgi:hypothetical protein